MEENESNVSKADSLNYGMIESAIITPYEKVLNILVDTKKFINSLDSKSIEANSPKKHTGEISTPKQNKIEEICKELDWVIKKIQSHSLYTYELDCENEAMEKFENPEIKSFFGFLSDFSQTNEVKRRNKLDQLMYNSGNFPEEAMRFKSDGFANKRGKDFLSKFGEGDYLRIRVSDAGNSDKSDTSREVNLTNAKINLEIVNDLTNNENKSVNNIKDSLIIKETSCNYDSSPNERDLRDLVEDSLKNIVIVKRASQIGNKNPFMKVNQEENKLINLIPVEEGIRNSNNLNDSNKAPNSSNLPQIEKDILSLNNIKRILQETEDSFNMSLSKVEVANTLSPFQAYDIDPKEILSKDLDIFLLESKVGRINVLPIIGHTIYTTMSLTNSIKEEKLGSFLTAVSSHYNDKVFYHNSLHGADVAQTLATYLLNSELEIILLLSSNDILAMITAALAHDVGHPGTNNGYQTNSASILAITYNDQSVLENFHSSLLFRILRRDECNIFESVPANDYKQLRKRIILSILATDMVQHAKVTSTIKQKLNSYNNREDKSLPFIEHSEYAFDEQQKVIDFVLHCADLSHNTKKFNISYKWTEMLMEEFWLQGDMEKAQNLSVSFLCDRTTADVPQSQIGFVRGIIIPTFDILIDLLPSLDYLRTGVDTNLEEWTDIVEKGNRTSLLGRSPRKTAKKGV